MSLHVLRNFCPGCRSIHKLHVYTRKNWVSRADETGGGRRGLNGTVDNNLSATRMGCVRLIYIRVHNSLPVLCRRPLRRDGQMTMVAKCRRTQGNTRVDPTYAYRMANAILILLREAVRALWQHIDSIASISIRVATVLFSFRGRKRRRRYVSCPSLLRDLVRTSGKPCREENASFLVQSWRMDIFLTLYPLILLCTAKKSYVEICYFSSFLRKAL